MASVWISLPERWQLQDVQAGLNVVIAVLSAVATYCFVRFCWQVGTHRIRKQGQAPLSTLLTTNTIGEVFDAITLLKLRILSRQHLLLFVQCFIVCVFAVAALCSGPIVRLSTRMGSKTKILDTSVYPAMKKFDIIACANTYWKDIDGSLSRANFPHDRLLDFLPNTTVNWTYVPDQWTTTWSLQCDTIPRTSFDMVSTGHCKGNTVPSTVPSVYEGMPGLYSIFNMSDFTVFGWDWSGFWVTDINPVQDMLMFLYGHNLVEQDHDTGIVYAMNFSMASVHFRGIGKNLTKPNDCTYAAGPIQNTTYTRINCALRRPKQVLNETLIPFPDSVDSNIIARQTNINFQGRFMMEAATNSTITEVQPEDIIRFYQVYMISKDTQFRQSVSRQLTVSQNLPQLSAAFLALALLVVVLCIATFSSWAVFTLTHKGVNEVPQSKLDWLLHAINPDDSLLPKSRDGGEYENVPEHGEPRLATSHAVANPQLERFESAAYVKELTRVKTSRPELLSTRSNSFFSIHSKESTVSVHESTISRSSPEPAYVDITDLPSPAMPGLPRRRGESVYYMRDLK